MTNRGGNAPGGRDGETLVLTDAHLDRVLSGDLPCAVCKYDLRGLSIRGICPECGTPVKATILFRVDPKAKEFRPLNAPLLTANGLALWTLGALLAAIGFWSTHLLAYARAELGMNIRHGLGEAIAVAGLTISWAGSLALIRPVKGEDLRKTLAALIGVLCYAALIWTTLRLHAHDRTHAIPYLDAPPDNTRIALRALFGVAMAFVILGLRPNARVLVGRCLVLRTGHVSRQTLLALVVTLGIGLVGDALQLTSWMLWQGQESVFSAVGTLLIALASAFILAGIIHAQLDTWQIRKSLLAPSPSFDELTADPADPDPPEPAPPA